MQQNEDIIKLAGVVEDLISRYNHLNQEKDELVLRLQGKEEHIQELQNTISGLKDEKTDAYQRVSGILGSIDAWEKGQQEHEKKSNDEKTHEPLSDQASNLFAMES